MPKHYLKRTNGFWIKLFRKGYVTVMFLGYAGYFEITPLNHHRLWFHGFNEDLFYPWKILLNGFGDALNGIRYLVGGEIILKNSI
jgi:hypothetical protein